VYLSKPDTDVKYHGLVCEVTIGAPDDLGTETGRSLDYHRYELRRVDTETTLPVQFRHHNLAPAAKRE